MSVMRKQLLLKFFNGDASEHEIDSIIEWIDKSPANKEYFARLKAIWAISQNKVTQQVCEQTIDRINQSLHPEQKSKQVFNYRLFSYYSSAAALVAICLSVGLFFLTKKEVPAIAATDTPKVSVNTLYTEKGVKGYITLPDGTKVWLNSDTKLTYPDAFAKDVRKISLSGEAYFEVKPDSTRPMIISTNKDFSVEVLGTSFNIKSYNNDLSAETTLYTGSIRMHYRNKKSKQIETVALMPNESFIYYDTDIKSKQTHPPKPEVPKAWKDGELIFDNTPMEEVIKVLERWHGTTFIINNPNIYNYKFTATFSSESIAQILDMMQYIMPVKYTYKNNTVTFL